LVSLKLKPFEALVASNIVVALKRLIGLNEMTMLVAARMPNGLQKFSVPQTDNS
jgi:hypothetical protein